MYLHDLLISSLIPRHRLFAGALLLLWAGLPLSVLAAKPVPVVVVVAEIRQLTPLIQVAGTVISRNDTRLAAQVEGQVTWVADVGTRLGVGDVAARLDEVLIRDALVEEEALVTREQANVTFHQADVKRLAQLAKDNHAAQSRLDQAQRDLSISRSELTAARSRVKQSKEKLDRAAIRAPFTGVVSDQFIQVGEWADPGTPVVRLVDTGALEAQAWVPVTALPYIRVNEELGLTVAGHATTGTVRTFVPVGDDQSRLYELRLTLGSGDWSAGQSVRVAIPTAESEPATVIPRDALVLRRDGATVFRVLADNTAERVTVTTGKAEGDLIEVIGAIQPGDRVVIRGGERLRAGQEVKVTGQVTEQVTEQVLGE